MFESDDNSSYIAKQSCEELVEPNVHTVVSHYYDTAGIRKKYHYIFGSSTT